jgi:hypothetical protein
MEIETLIMTKIKAFCRGIRRLVLMPYCTNVIWYMKNNLMINGEVV